MEVVVNNRAIQTAKTISGCLKGYYLIADAVVAPCSIIIDSTMTQQ